MTNHTELITKKLLELNEHQRFGFALKLIEKMLPHWDQYAAEKYSLFYVDSVVGMHHKVKPDIINRTFEIGMKSLMEDLTAAELIAIFDEYGDPIIAIQDMDWELPAEIEWLFFSAYNMMRYLTQAGPEPNDQIAYIWSIKL